MTSEPRKAASGTPRMKIAVASAYLGKVLRGVESWAQDLSAELHCRGTDVTLFKGGGPPVLSYERQVHCPDHTNPVWAKVTKLTRHGGWRIGLGSPLAFQEAVFGWRIATILRRERFDLVHTQDAGTALALQRARRIGLHRAKVILGHGTEESFEFLSRFEHVQELAPWHLEMDRRNGLPADRHWFTIPNFVDCSVYCPGDRAAARRKFGIPEDRFVVLDAAAVKLTHKRLDWLAQEIALARQTHPEVMLVVAGAVTPETPAVERVFRERLGENAILLKNQPRREMPELYRTADIFAHAALKEMLAIVLLEAMATGIPIRAHEHPVIRWVVGSGGATANMECKGELSRSIVESIENPELRTRHAGEARKRASETFNTKAVVDEIVKMYEIVLERR